MNICFIIDLLTRLESETGSTVRLIHEAVLRGHNVGIVFPQNLTIRQSCTYGFVKMITPVKKLTGNSLNFFKKINLAEKMFPLSGFDAIFVRTPPPLEPVMLNFLDSVKDDTFIINDIDGLRKASNKLYSASFDDPKNKIIPITHVSKNKEFLKKVIRESEKDKMILKPYDGYGGTGVIILEKGAIQNINSILDFYITRGKTSNYVILQEYVDGAQEGDVRVLMLNGEPIGAYRRIPMQGDIRSNIHAGGTAEKYVMTKIEKNICQKISSKLISDGLYFVGLDIIKGKLIEINVCSPGGITRINKFNRTNLQKKVIDFVENVVHLKELAIDRKRNFRKLIEDSKDRD